MMVRLGGTGLEATCLSPRVHGFDCKLVTIDGPLRNSHHIHLCPVWSHHVPVEASLDTHFP